MSPRCLFRLFVDRCLLTWALFIEKTVLLCFAWFCSKWRETALWMFPGATQAGTSCTLDGFRDNGDRGGSMIHLVESEGDGNDGGGWLGEEIGERCAWWKKNGHTARRCERRPWCSNPQWMLVFIEGSSVQMYEHRREWNSVSQLSGKLQSGRAASKRWSNNNHTLERPSKVKKSWCLGVAAIKNHVLPVFSGVVWLLSGTKRRFHYQLEFAINEIFTHFLEFLKICPKHQTAVAVSLFSVVLRNTRHEWPSQPLHQQPTTRQHAVHSKPLSIQAQKLEENNLVKKLERKKPIKGKVGWDHQVHTSRLPLMIKNHMYTRRCLFSSARQRATDGISHEGPHFFRDSCSAVKNLCVFFCLRWRRNLAQNSWYQTIMVQSQQCPLAIKS